jgi:hypothetical protein
MDLIDVMDEACVICETFGAAIKKMGTEQQHL